MQNARAKQMPENTEKGIKMAYAKIYDPAAFFKWVISEIEGVTPNHGVGDMLSCIADTIGDTIEHNQDACLYGIPGMDILVFVGNGEWNALKLASLPEKWYEHALSTNGNVLITL